LQPCVLGQYGEKNIIFYLDFVLSLKNFMCQKIFCREYIVGINLSLNFAEKNGCKKYTVYTS
jgi:hypothetical protein